jgi:TolA-binding protein
MYFEDGNGNDMSGYVEGLDSQIRKLENRVEIYRGEQYKQQLKIVELQREVHEQHDEIQRLLLIIARKEAEEKQRNRRKNKA